MTINLMLANHAAYVQLSPLKHLWWFCLPNMLSDLCAIKEACGTSTGISSIAFPVGYQELAPYWP
jgi:hypothetical protein